MRFPRVAGVLSAFAALVAALELSAEPRGVNLQQELDAARLVARVRIIAYRVDGLEVQPQPEPSASVRLRYSDDPSWIPIALLRRDWQRGTDPQLTAMWPPLGAEVLVVADAHQIVSLFAWPIGNSYRFWSPVMTGSIALFNCEAPAEPVRLLSADQPLGSKTSFRSWDGCLVPASVIPVKGVPGADAP